MGRGLRYETFHLSNQSESLGTSNSFLGGGRAFECRMVAAALDVAGPEIGLAAGRG
jgi:hypothetical protein